MREEEREEEHVRIEGVGRAEERHDAVDPDLDTANIQDNFEFVRVLRPQA